MKDGSDGRPRARISSENNKCHFKYLLCARHCSSGRNHREPQDSLSFRGAGMRDTEPGAECVKTGEAMGALSVCGEGTAPT